MVENSWNSFQVNGKKTYIFKEKLKLLEMGLKVWNKEVFEILDLDVEKAIDDLNRLDHIVSVEADPLSIIIVEQRSEAQSQVWKKLQYREVILKQKSKRKWLKQADHNSKYFHFLMKAMFKRNGIVALHSEDSLIEDVNGIKSIVFNHFKNKFKEKVFNRPRMEDVHLKRLSARDSSSLEPHFSLEEIKFVIWESNVIRSRGRTISK
ncbi:unnamed protein product [Lathyrus oleraceus]